MKTKYFSIRRSMPAIIIAVLTFCCFTTASNATVFYINVNGNDVTGNGTANSPWKTLYKATSVVSAVGDIIHVTSGTYIETTKSLLKPGVSIEGDGITSVIKSTLSAQFVPIISAQSAEGTNGNQHISNLKFDGTNLTTSWAIAINGRSNFSIYNCTFVDFQETGVNWSGRNDGVQAAPTIYSTGNSFHDNIMNNCATADNVYGRGCFQFGGQDGMLIYNNTITNNSRAAGTNGWPLKGCNDSYIKNCKIYNNVLTSAPFPYYSNGDNGYWDFSIEIFDNLGGTEIYGNTMTGSLDMNRQSKGSAAFSVWIHDNVIGFPTFQANRQSGIILEYSTETGIIENNTIRNVADGIIFSTRSASAITNTSIQKNLMYGIGSPTGGYGNGIGFFTDGSNNYSVSTMHIYNNTIVAATGGKSPYWGISFSNAASVNQLVFKNNIVTGFNFGGAPMVSNVLGNITNSQFQYNDFYNNSNSDDPFPTWASSTTLGAGSTISNNIKSNPMFISSTDFRLQPGSPAVDAGTFVGLPYAGTAPDRGYIETGMILPIKLLDLIVTNNNGKNLLQWKTATEVNSDHFNIERSSNGIDFAQVGTVQAAGFSGAELAYSFTDANPLSGINYYRLVMVDKDKSADLSNVVSISKKKMQSMNIVNVQLSSTRSNLSLAVSSTQNAKALLTIFDANGRSVLNVPVALQTGINRIDKNTSFVSKGIYYVKLVTSEESLVKNVFATE